MDRILLIVHQFECQQVLQPCAVKNARGLLSPLVKEEVQSAQLALQSLCLSYLRPKVKEH